MCVCVHARGGDAHSPPASSDIRGLSNVSHLEQLNKRYWYVCQDYSEYKYPHQPKRFPEIMMCLPEIRCIAGEPRRGARLLGDGRASLAKGARVFAGKLVSVPLEQLPLLFKAVLHSCRSSLSSFRSSLSPRVTPSSGN